MDRRQSPDPVVQHGDHVTRRNQELVRIDSRKLRAKINELRSEFETAKG